MQFFYLNYNGSLLNEILNFELLVNFNLLVDNSNFFLKFPVQAFGVIFLIKIFEFKKII